MSFQKKYQFLYIISFTFSLIILIYMYTLSSPLPIGWDTPVYVYNIDGITEHGSNWLTMNDRFVYKTNYFILGSVISSILGIDNLTLQIVYPIVISSIILIILIVFACEKGGYYKYTPVAAIFWICLYKMSETNATLLFSLNIFIILYILDKKEMQKYYAVLTILLTSLIMIHFIQAIFFMPIIISYIALTKQINVKKIKGTLLVLFTLLCPYLYLNLNLIKRFIVKESTGTLQVELTPHKILLDLFGIEQFLFLTISIFYLLIIYKNKRETFLFPWTCWILLFIIPIWFFGFPHYPYNRLIFVAPIPILLSFSLYQILNIFKKNRTLLLIIIPLIIIPFTLSTVAYSTSVHPWISHETYQKVEILAQNKTTNSIVPVYPIQTSIGSWIIALKGDYIFYGKVSELLDNTSYNYDPFSGNKYRSKLKLINDGVYKDGKINESYTIYIIKDVYRVEDFNMNSTREIYPGIYELKVTQNSSISAFDNTRE